MVPPPNIRTTEILMRPIITAVARKWTKPVGAALLLLASFAQADTSVITAPQGNQGACPFPGCQGTTSWVDVSREPYNASGGGQGDLTGSIQRAVDSGAAVVYFPAGTYPVCNLFARAVNQRWVGAGPGQTIITGTANCNNLIVQSFSGVFMGPVQHWGVEGITFSGGVQAQIVAQCRDIERITIRNNAFDSGGVGCPTTSAGPNGINMSGCRDFLIEGNEFYSSCPGSGGRGMFLTGVRGGVIQRNTSNWQRTFIELASTTNQPIEFTDISNNIYHGTFWGTPTKYTNSGGTVTYAATTLTDTAANFAGLCDQGAASPCSAAAGNFVRVLTSKATGTTANFNTGGGYLTDAGANFTGASVQRGDIVKTTPVCFGNGSKGQAARFVCTGSAGTSSWGDSCVCTANADCSSGICEPRWATVDTVASATVLQVDEWVRETSCPLGSAICATSTRRPTTAVLTTGGIAYTVYGWTMCHIASYTSTVLTCDTDGWVSWTGSASTPSNGTLYEVMWTRPLYFLLAGNTGITALQGLRAVNNTVVGGFADHFELTGTRMVVEANHSRDCGDTCYVFAGDQFTVGNNVAEHCGARGMIAIGNDQTWGNNIAVDSPWIRTSNTTTAGDINVNGSRNLLVGNKVKAELPVNLNRYGIVSFGTADQNQFVNNTCQGTYSQGCFRFDGAASTNNHLIGYHGETISNNAGTFSIEGGLCTQAQLPAAQNGSSVGCSDCTTASNPCTGAGGGSAAFRTGGAWKCP